MSNEHVKMAMKSDNACDFKWLSDVTCSYNIQQLDLVGY